LLLVPTHFPNVLEDITAHTFFKVGLFFQLNEIEEFFIVTSEISSRKNAWEGTKNAVVWRTAVGGIFDGCPGSKCDEGPPERGPAKRYVPRVETT
jgi:hypothetical protein